MINCAPSYHSFIDCVCIAWVITFYVVVCMKSVRLNVHHYLNAIFTHARGSNVEQRYEHILSAAAANCVSCKWTCVWLVGSVFVHIVLQGQTTLRTMTKQRHDKARTLRSGYPLTHTSTHTRTERTWQLFEWIQWDGCVRLNTNGAQSRSSRIFDHPNRENSTQKSIVDITCIFQQTKALSHRFILVPKKNVKYAGITRLTQSIVERLSSAAAN